MIAVSAEDTDLAAAAVTALHDELKAYPKPGLVSPVDSGAHTDMDCALMCRSAESLREPLAELAAVGRAGRSFEDALMPIGIAAEQRMLAATGGVNAHRGAIFSMGLIVAATARAMTLSISIGPDSIRAALKHAWGDALEAHANRGMTTVSHGALVRRTTGRDGARREAALAFPSVFDVGLPALHQALAAGLDPNAAHIHTLFVLMAAVDDTTVLYRGGVDAGAFVRQSAAAFLADGGCFRPEWHEKAVRLHRTFTDRNLSAGGCADLLACTILLSNCCGPNNFGA